MGGEQLKEVEAGEPISAAHYNQLVREINKQRAYTRGDGIEGVDTPQVPLRGVNKDEILFVRIVEMRIPESAIDYVPSDSFNAVVLIWDAGEGEWAEDPEGREVEVIPLRDGTGYVPIEPNREMAVRYDSNAGAYVPLETPDNSVVMPTTETVDADGMQEGVRLKWDSDNKTWLVVEDVYVLRIGT